MGYTYFSPTFRQDPHAGSDCYSEHVLLSQHSVCEANICSLIELNFSSQNMALFRLNGVKLYK